ncbi:hypothetical protein GQ44DRAFT_473320 [Phaeosphaeriaceae sp. PMI808]|nr:hypothetical protein GQ44DRAFT_473320 [Phaeosphaeriaceae sp. PMI808]
MWFGAYLCAYSGRSAHLYYLGSTRDMKRFHSELSDVLIWQSYKIAGSLVKPTCSIMGKYWRIIGHKDRKVQGVLGKVVKTILESLANQDKEKKC